MQNQIYFNWISSILAELIVCFLIFNNFILVCQTIFVIKLYQILEQNLLKYSKHILSNFVKFVAFVLLTKLKNHLAIFKKLLSCF